MPDTLDTLRRHLHDARNDAAGAAMMLEAIRARLGCASAVDILRALDEQAGHLAAITVIWRAGLERDTKSGWNWVAQALAPLATAYARAGGYLAASDINYCALMALLRRDMAPVLTAEAVPA